MKFSESKKIDHHTNNNQTSHSIDKIMKTTNINILLNRVRIENKKMFKKKIFFFISIVSILSFLGIIALGN